MLKQFCFKQNTRSFILRQDGHELSVIWLLRHYSKVYSSLQVLYSRIDYTIALSGRTKNHANTPTTPDNAVAISAASQP